MRSFLFDEKYKFLGHHCKHPEPEIVLPDSDLEHATEQLRVVGDNPSNMDDQLLLKNGLSLPTVSRALAVDDALDHPWWEWIRDHLLLLTEQTEGHLVKTGLSTCACVQEGAYTAPTCS